MEVLQNILVAALNIAIMLSVGLELAPRHFVAVFRRPLVLVLGLLINHVVIPLVAVGVGEAMWLTVPATTGLLVCAAAPGGPVGTLLTQHARGDVALSVSLVVVMTLINTVATPATLQLFDAAPSGVGSPVGISSMATTIVLYQLLPLAVGMTARAASPGLSARVLPYASGATKALFGLIFVGLGVVEMGHVLAVGWASLLAIEVCTVASIALGLYLVPTARTGRVALGLGSANRNIALALLLTSVWFEDPVVLVTVMVYGLVMLLNVVPVSLLMRARASARAAGR